MNSQLQRLTWRLAKKDRGTDTKQRELWLHRPGEDPIHVGGIEYYLDRTWNERWQWYSTERPWADLQGSGRFYSSETFATSDEAAKHLRTRPHIQRWPEKHCLFCTAIGCTECTGEFS